MVVTLLSDDAAHRSKQLFASPFGDQQFFTLWLSLTLSLSLSLSPLGSQDEFWHSDDVAEKASSLRRLALHLTWPHVATTRGE